MPQVDGPTLDSAVWDYITVAMQDDAILFGDLEERRAKARRARDMLLRALLALEGQDQKARDKLDRLLDLYAEGELDKPAYIAKRGEIERETERRSAERADLERQLGEQSVLTPAQEGELRQLRAKIAAGLIGATLEDKVRILDALAVACVYDGDTGDLSISGVLGNHTLNVISG